MLDAADELVHQTIPVAVSHVLTKQAGSDFDRKIGSFPAKLALGAAMDNIPVYMTLGIVLGILFGSIIDMNKRRKSKD